MKDINEIIKWLDRADNRKFFDEWSSLDYDDYELYMFAKDLASLIIKFNEENKLSDEEIKKNAEEYSYDVFSSRPIGCEPTDEEIENAYIAGAKGLIEEA